MLCGFGNFVPSDRGMNGHDLQQAHQTGDRSRRDHREGGRRSDRWVADEIRGVHGCLIRMLVPLMTPATALAEPPTAPVLDPGRIIPVPPMAGPPIDATWLACMARSG